ncbi:MAG: response regulator transcription factor [Hymenobacter sp.]|nr:MAG: response regulator transcription factor [Hymenobacter sp.]
MTPPTSRPAVLVAAEPTLYWAGLVSLLTQQWPTLALTLTADIGQVADLIRTQPFQLLILDDHLPNRGLLALLNCLRQARPTQKILLLTANTKSLLATSPTYILIPRNIAPSHLAITLGPLLESTPYQCIPPRAFHLSPTRFSSRELEVLRLVVEDYCNQEIADHLYLSVRTIESHRRALLQKSGTRTLTGLVAWALRAGLIA